jgi:phage-related minor tail protein
MTDDVFRIIVAVAVVIAAIAFVAQAALMAALYSAARKMQKRTEPLVERLEPVIAKAGPVIDKVQGVIEKAGPLIDKAGPVIEKVGPVLDKVGPAIEKTGPVMERASRVLDTTHQILQEARPRITDVSENVVAIVRSGRDQVQEVGTLVHEAGERARARMAQIDETVDHTVEQIEQVGGTMKRGMMKPIREVNGLAAGIAAGLVALVRGRKFSVDAATQDEEMFI